MGGAGLSKRRANGLVTVFGRLESYLAPFFLSQMYGVKFISGGLLCEDGETSVTQRSESKGQWSQ